MMKPRTSNLSAIMITNHHHCPQLFFIIIINLILIILFQTQICLCFSFFKQLSFFSSSSSSSPSTTTTTTTLSPPLPPSTIILQLTPSSSSNPSLSSSSSPSIISTNHSSPNITVSTLTPPINVTVIPPISNTNYYHKSNGSFNTNPNLVFFHFNDSMNFHTFFNATNNHYVAEESSPEPSSEYFAINPPNDSKGFEVIIQNDKTLAHLIFDKQGQDVIYCELFDLEKEPQMVRLPLVLSEYQKRPLVVDHLTMLEAVRRCSSLAMDKYDWNINKTSTINPLISTTDRTKETISGSDVIQDNYPSINNTAKIEKNSTNQLAAGSVKTLTTTQPLLKPTIPSSWVGEFNVNHFITFWRGILPGTKWCGLGDMADRYEDLGFKLDIDLCCRAHDHCPIRLKAFRTGYGVFNFSFYSRLHCDCDEDFYQCLKRSPNAYASMLGHFYFNVLKIYCLKEDFFITSPSPNTNTTLPQQMVCLKKKKTTLGEECLEQVPIPDPVGTVGGGRRMKIVPFGRHF